MCRLHTLMEILMKRFPLVTLGLLAAVAAGTALAADEKNATPAGMPHTMMHEKMFKDTDTDGDGFITKEEWQAKGDKMFSEIDANHDGKISKDEMKAHHDMKRAEWEKHKAEHEEKVEEHKEKVKAKADKKAADAAAPADKK